MDSRKAVILSSGGIDSTTVLAIARSEGYEMNSLTFDYGQRHAHELKAAARVAEFFGVARHLVLRVDLRPIGGSALTDAIAVPKGREEPAKGPIPPTYVPARNTIFLAYGLAWAEVLGAGEIFIGVTAVDYSGYPDCRPEFIAAFERLANLATKAAVEGKKPVSIRAPLISMSKAQIIKTGLALGVDYSLTHSCYDPSPEGKACGSCDSCRLRQRGFAEAGIRDPIDYL